MKKICLILLLALSSCGNNTKKETAEISAQNFPYLTIPPYIQDRTEALKYLAKNFWKPYFKAAAENNSLYNIDSIKFEEAYGRYAQTLNVLEMERQKQSQSTANSLYSLISSSQKQLFATVDSLYLINQKSPLSRLIALSEKYFYNPNSPCLNEEVYIPALEAIINLKSLDPANKLTYKWQLDLASMNRTGTKAANFEFISKKGSALKTGTLHNINAQFTLLYFNNPDCNACRGQQNILFSSQHFARLFAQGKIKVLSMYIDEEAELWEKHQHEAPQSPNWIYARDPHLTLRNNELYGIRAIPSMYLLDNKKNVILKDATAETVVAWISNIQL